MLRFSAYFNRRLGTHPRVSHAEIISLFYGTPWITWDLIHNNGGACCIGGLELLCQHLDRSSCIVFLTFYSYTLINLRKSSFFIPFSSHDAFWLVLAMYHKFSPILFLDLTIAQNKSSPGWPIHRFLDSLSKNVNWWWTWLLPSCNKPHIFNYFTFSFDIEKQQSVRKILFNFNRSWCPN